MRIYEFSPFNNENLLMSIKSMENINVVNELHITEVNKTHTYLDKQYNYDSSFFHDNVCYHRADGGTIFRKPSIGLSRKFPYIKKKKYAWQNDAIQRNLASSYINFNDDDILILSDIDEIIHNTSILQVIEDAKRYGIISIRLHVTLYYLNLFLINPAGPPDYSYRVFIMTGKYFKEMKYTVDQLRKLGEAGKLSSDIYCSSNISGFHHTFLGDDKFIANKIKAYPHAPDEHHPSLFSSNGEVNMDYLKYCIDNQISIFGDQHVLKVDNSINQLSVIEKNRNFYSNLFL